MFRPRKTKADPEEDVEAEDEVLQAAVDLGGVPAVAEPRGGQRRRPRHVSPSPEPEPSDPNARDHRMPF